MSTNRNRMTWAAGRSASAAPQIPGYGTEDQDHPAHQADPAYEAYKKGDPSAWAEDVRKPPYAQGNPPAIPGYDTEDQDHPAHKEQPRVPKEARSLRAAVERKAQKCIRIARAMLGKKASSDTVENQALDMMDWSDSRINATLERIGGGFLAEEMAPQADFGEPDFDDFGGPANDFGDMDDDDLDMMLAEEAPDAGKKSEMDEVLGALSALTEKVQSLKKADQNDPKGPTLAPKAKDEDAARKEAKKAEGEDEPEVKPEDKPEEKKEAAARKAARKFFASMDTDNDGFVMQAEWVGSQDLFAALDTDRDGILASEEVIDALSPEPVVAAVTTVAGLDPAEAAMLSEMEATFMKAAKLKALKAKKAEPEEEAPVASKKAEAEEDEEEAPVAAKKGGKKAKKAEAEDEEDEEDAPTAGKKACGDDAGMFGMTGDPMGLADGSDDVLGDDDEALLASIFGGKSAKAEDEDEEEEAPVASKKAKKSEDEDEDDGAEEDEAEDEDEEEEAPVASKKAKKSEDEDEGEDEDASPAAKKAMRLASQRPQPRKASTGVRTVGGLTRTASAGGEVDELSRLWESAPDVSKVFNG